ncbi:hypothetical protein MMPV_007231 [Pyropia vietnamensis]
MADERIPTGDLVFVSISVAFSLMLASVVALRERLRLSPTVELAATAITVTGCLAFGFAALGLAFARRISLDAMSAAFIGLLPAVQAGPLLDFRLPAARVQMKRRPELGGAGGELRYIRLGSVVVDDDRVVRLISRSPHAPRGWSRSATAVAPAAPVSLLFILRHVSAQKPRKMERSMTPPLTSSDAAVAGLAAAADLVVAGDLALYFFSGELQHMVLREIFQMALRGTPASVTNALLDAVGLGSSWGPINAAAVRAFATDFDSCCRAHRYGVLFFLLVVASDLFSIDEPSVSGNVLAERLTDTVAEDEMRDLTHRWLAGWGLAVGGSSDGLARQTGVVDARPTSESNASASPSVRRVPTVVGEAVHVAMSQVGS